MGSEAERESVAARVVPLVTARALASPFDYAVAAGTPVGAIVEIPLGARRVRGVVTEVGGAPATEVELKRAEPTGEAIQPDLVELGLRVAERYGTAPARGLQLVLPPAAADRRTPWLERCGSEPPRGAKALRVWELLAAGPRPLDELREASGASAATIRRLRELGAVAEVEPQAPALSAVAEGLPLTAAQRVAVDRILELMEAGTPAAPPQPVLLHGVTGSGKTEVFLRAVERALELGRGALVLVPEIALAPQTAARVEARFGARAAVLHSGLSDGERARAWHRIRRGEADVVVGPRSAVFAPLARIGVIVIDEEHESAYKQESDPRYDARAVAVLRGRAHGALVICASATPRPESWHALEHLQLPERIGGRLPPIRIVDLRLDGGYPLSRPLHDELAALAAEGGRAILLVNRRGEASALHCRACGVLVECEACDVAMTLHRALYGLVCHHCGRRAPVPRTCAHCGAVDLSRVGSGTERLEAVVAERFPEVEVLRLDADVASRRGALEEVLERFGTAERAVLVGTQIVAKGHHFDGVRLAAAIDADLGLAQPDFRAEERTFSLLVQLAGRAGREGSGGRVIIQSWEPDERAIRLAAGHAVGAFLTGELERREALGYPPFKRLVRVLVTGPTPAIAVAALSRVAAVARPQLPGDELLGPAALFRVRGRDRAHLLVKTARPQRAGAVFGRVLAEEAQHLRRDGVKAVVDVDPQTL